MFKRVPKSAEALRIVALPLPSPAPAEFVALHQGSMARQHALMHQVIFMDHPDPLRVSQHDHLQAACAILNDIKSMPFRLFQGPFRAIL